jgi:hypothetical protein
MHAGSFAIACLLLTASGSAAAQATPVHAQVALASDLTERGLLYGPVRPVLQAEVSASFGAWSAALAAGAQSNTSQLERVSARLTRYWALSNDWQADAELNWYDYRRLRYTPGYSATELGVSASFRDLLSLGASVRNYSDAGAPGLRGAVDAGLRWPLAGRWSVTANLGWAQLPTYEGTWYSYGSGGVGWESGGWNAGLGRTGASRAAREQLGGDAQSHWTAFVAKEF